jgi:hypothetical protein
MPWDLLFSVTNAIALIGWLLLWFAPRTPLVHSAVMYLGIGLLCLIYIVCFAAVMTGSGGATGGGGFTYDIPGIRALFASDGGIVVGWTHYLAFDLFVGLWIAKDADSKGFSRIVQFPFLFFTLMAGPVGLFGWLIVRERKARAAAGR